MKRELKYAAFILVSCLDQTGSQLSLVAMLALPFLNFNFENPDIYIGQKGLMEFSKKNQNIR